MARRELASEPSDGLLRVDLGSEGG